MSDAAQLTAQPGGFVLDRVAANAHVMQPPHTRGVVSSRGLEEGRTRFTPRSISTGATLSFNTDGFVAALTTALANNTAGYVMQLRQHGKPIASAQVNWAKRPSDGSEAWAQSVRMHIASCSKLITAIAMTRTLAAHNLPPSTKIIDYLPAYWSKGPNIDKITFAQLMTHKSGFRVSVGGLFYFHDRANENETANLTFLLSPTLGFNTGAATIAQQSSTSVAAFGQVSYTPPILDDKFEITGGLRFTRDAKSVIQSQPFTAIETRHFYDLSYAVTLNYHLTDDLMAYFRVSTGYRSGGFNIRAQAGQGYDFAPEDALVYEGGIKSEWFEHRLRANVSAFYTDYSNLQVAQFTGLSGIGSGGAGVKNANADYTGFELELQARPVEAVTIDGSIGYVHPEYRQIFFPNPVTGALQNYAASAHFPYVPEWTNHVGVQYQLPDFGVGKLSLRADYAYQSSKYFFATDLPTQDPFNDAIKAPDQHLLSARITLADVPVWGGRAMLETSLWGENLLNDNYVIQGVDFGPSLGFATKTYGVPRTVGFDIKVKY